MKNIKDIAILLLIFSIVAFESGSSQAVYSNNLRDGSTNSMWEILFKTDVQKNSLEEFYKFENGSIGIFKVSNDGKKIALTVSFAAGIKTTGYLSTLEIISSDAEFIMSMSELNNYHILDFSFDPTSKFISFVAGISNPNTDSDFPRVPIGFGILDIDSSTIEWIVGGPDNKTGPVIKASSWPEGGLIYAYGWTNDDNKLIQSYGIDPITHKAITYDRTQGNQGGYELKMFKINPVSLEVSVTDLPLENSDTFSPDGKYYYGTSYFHSRFKIFDSNTGEDISANLYETVGDTLYTFGLSIRPQWLGNKGSVLALDIIIAERYKRDVLTSSSHWIYDVSTEEVLYEDYSDKISFSIGHYWNSSRKDFIVKDHNNEFKSLDSKIVDIIIIKTTNK